MNAIVPHTSNRELAAERFTARGNEIINLLFRGIGDEQEINARYGYRHGWISVNGEGFNMETAFPDHIFPRFPADQGLSD